MKVLVTGASGLIGHQIAKDLVRNNHQVYACYNTTNPTFGIPTKIDFTDISSIDVLLDDICPDIVVHAAAMTNVDLCEKEKKLATLLNVTVTEKIAKAALKNNSFLLYISTDYVFDGIHGMKNENDITNPINHYGKTKLDGEYCIKNILSDYCIIRTSTPFGVHPSKNSFLTWSVKEILKQSKINVITDQFSSPTYIPNLSEMILELLSNRTNGLFHLACSTNHSRFEMVKLLIERLSLDPSFLYPSKMIDMNWNANRPKNSTLDVSHALHILKNKPQSFENCLTNFVKDLHDQKII